MEQICGSFYFDISYMECKDINVKALPDERMIEYNHNYNYGYSYNYIYLDKFDLGNENIVSVPFLVPTPVPIPVSRNSKICLNKKHDLVIDHITFSSKKQDQDDE